MTILLASCSDPACGAVFPVAAELAWRRVRCPDCSAEGAAIAASVRQKLREEVGPPPSLPELPDDAVVVVLEDLRSLHNVGSILRTCDAFAVDLVVMCGVTATPEHPKMSRTALGAERTVAWTWRADALTAIDELRARHVEIVALERSERATNLATARISRPFGVVIGNEVAGVSTPALERAAHHVAIPMLGSKTSLNAAVACAVALWQLRNHG